MTHVALSYPVLDELYGDTIKKNFNLSPYLTMKMQVVAQYYYEATSLEDWKKIITTTYQHHIPFVVLGGGSNVATFQHTIEGIVIRNRYTIIETIDETETYIDLKIGSGYPIGRLVKETISKGLSGFEYHMGLPGTLGGGIYMNSKWTKPVSYIGDQLLKGTLLSRNATVRVEPRDYFAFAYDYSKLQQTGEIFLDGVFRLIKEDPVVLEKRAQESLAYRKKTQPFGGATVGCFFQNISEQEQNKHGLPTSSAGYLIDQVGMRGKQIGGFEISPVHANFVINKGKGNPDDLAMLMKQVKQAVKQKFDIELTEEVQII